MAEGKSEGLRSLEVKWVRDGVEGKTGEWGEGTDEKKELERGKILNVLSIFEERAGGEKKRLQKKSR